MGSGVVKYVQPVSRSSADSVVARVYEQLEREFGVHADPIVLHSPAAELLAGAWMVCRETLVAPGDVGRATKEAVATAVSAANDCPFCVDAHAAMLAATGNTDTARLIDSGAHGRIADPHVARIVAWAAATRSKGAEILCQPPFEREHASELIGTALLFHYINRPVSVFLGETPFPFGRGVLWGAQLRFAGRRFKPFASKAHAPGASLSLLPEAELPEDFGWARDSQPVAGAWARFAAAVERAGDGSLEPEARARVLARLRAWNGQTPPLSGDWLQAAVEGLGERHKPAVRLAMLTALAPYRVIERDVEAFREAGANGRASDEQLVGAVAWASLAAARRVGSWLRPR